MKYFLFILFSISSFLYSNPINEYNKEGSVVIFMYHHFGKSKYPSTNIRLEQFNKQLDYLKANDYNVWPLSKVINALKNKYAIPDKTVSITIDDAYISVYKHAYPMLKSRGFPYTVFVNTNAIGTKSINYMTWEHMKEMQDYGAEFANHSSTHAYLMPSDSQTTKQWQNMIKEEVKQAQKVLQNKLGRNTNESPRVLSYPFGEYTLASAKYIESMGYIGVTQTSGVANYKSDLRRIPRFAMSEKFAHMEGFLLKLNTKALPVKSTKPWDTKIQTNPPSLTVELDEPIKNIGCYTSSGKRINVNWLSETKFEVKSENILQGERDRYTCTAPAKDGKWYWYSHLWIL